MDIIIPSQIGDAELISTNAPTDDDPPEWDRTLNYSEGFRVQTENVIYEALQTNTDQNPSAVSSADFWLRIGMTNIWRAFDNKINAKVIGTGSLEYVVRPTGDLIEAVAIFGLVGELATVVMTDPVEGEVFNQSVELFDNSAVRDWFTYFFEPIEQLEEAIFFDVPPYAGAEIKITVSGPGRVEIGQLIAGRHKNLGTTLLGSSTGIEDYSRKERDVFGNPQIVQRAFSYLVEYDVAYETENVYAIRRTLANLRTTPIVWIGAHERRYGTIVLGYYRRFDIVLSEPTVSEGSIEVEGLI